MLVEVFLISLLFILVLRVDDGFWCFDIECINGLLGDVKYMEFGSK